MSQKGPGWEMFFGALALFLVMGWLAHLADLQESCEGQVVRNAWNWPVCVEKAKP